MLLIIRNEDGCQTYAVNFRTKEIWAGVLTYPNPKVHQLFERHLAQAGQPSELMERLGSKWHLVDGFLRATQSELDLSGSTALPRSAKAPQQPGPHPLTPFLMEP